VRAPVVPPALAGAGRTRFAGGLLGMYLRTPGRRQEGSLAPTQQGIAIVLVTHNLPLCEAPGGHLWRRLTREAVAAGELLPQTDADRVGALLFRIISGAFYEWVGNALPLDKVEAETEFSLASALYRWATPGAQRKLSSRLRKMPGPDNLYKRTVCDFARDAPARGFSATLSDRRMWGRMRMTPTDLSDVNANTYTYLMNGTTSLGNWTGLFRPGEKVRLRFINGSSMTHFDVRIPGLKMTVVAADGNHVQPVAVDEFRIAAAETFDVIVEPTGGDAYCIFAQDMGRTGFISGTLAVAAGLRAPVPAIDPRPILSMADLGHGGMDHAVHDMTRTPATTDDDMAGVDHSAMPEVPAAVVHPASATGKPLGEIPARPFK